MPRRFLSFNLGIAAIFIHVHLQQEITQDFRILLGVGGALLVEAGGKSWCEFIARPAIRRYREALSSRARNASHRAVSIACPLLHAQVHSGQCVPYPAVEARKPVLLDLPEHSSTIGTGEERGTAKRASLEISSISNSAMRVSFAAPRGVFRGGSGSGGKFLLDELQQLRWDLFQWHNMCTAYLIQGTSRHGREESGLRILNHSNDDDISMKDSF